MGEQRTITAILKVRSDTSANWTAINPVLMNNEVGYDTTNKKFKIGDGLHNWAGLSYVNDDNVHKGTSSSYLSEEVYGRKTFRSGITIGSDTVGNNSDTNALILNEGARINGPSNRTLFGFNSGATGVIMSHPNYSLILRGNTTRPYYLTSGSTITSSSPQLALYSDIPSLSNYVDKTSAQTISGLKTFTTRPTLLYELPSEYEEVEWIQSTSSSNTVGPYINTNIVFKTLPLVITDIYLASSTDRDVMGTSSATANCFIVDYAGSNFYYRYGASSYGSVVSSGLTTNSWYHVEFGPTYTAYDSSNNVTAQTTKTSYNFSGNTLPLLIHKARYAGDVRFKRIQIYDNYILKGYLIPCKRVSDDEIGYYDFVSKQFFTNQQENTTFTCGDTVSNSEPYQSDFITLYDLARVASTGSYTDLSDKPNLSVYALDSTVAKLTADNTFTGSNTFNNFISVEDGNSEIGLVLKTSSTQQTQYKKNSIVLRTITNNTPSDVTLTYPSTSGTLALTSDIPSVTNLVTGASSSTDNAVVRFDGTGGKTIQNSNVTIADTGSITIGGTWTDTSANNPFLSMGGYAKLTGNTAGAFTFAPSNTPSFLANTTEFRPISGTKNLVDIGSASYGFRNGYFETSIQAAQLYTTGSTIKRISALAASPTTTYTYTLPNATGTVALTSDIPSVSDYVVGPASSTNTAIAIYDGTGGKTIKNTSVTIDSSNNVKTAGSIILTTINGSITASGSSRIYFGSSTSSYYSYLGSNTSGAFSLGSANGAFTLYANTGSYNCIMSNCGSDLGRNDTDGSKAWKNLYTKGDIYKYNGSNSYYKQTLPSKAGTFAMTSDIPTTAADINAVATSSISTSISSSSTNSEVASAKAVYDAIEALPEPMIFKGSLGTGGTITALPTAAASNEGFTYKVITAGTYEGLTCKIGDTVICANSGTTSNPSYTWVLIPSGDEPSGTVTSVGLTVPTGLSVSGSPITSSGTLAVTFASGYSIPTTAKQQEWDAKQSANDATLTIQRNSSSIGTFSANASSNVTVNIQDVYTVSLSDIDLTQTTATTYVFTSEFSELVESMQYTLAINLALFDPQQTGIAYVKPGFGGVSVFGSGIVYSYECIPGLMQPKTPVPMIFYKASSSDTQLSLDIQQAVAALSGATAVGNVSYSNNTLSYYDGDMDIDVCVAKTLNSNSILGSDAGTLEDCLIARPSSVPTATASSADFVAHNGKLYTKKIVQSGNTTTYSYEEVGEASAIPQVLRYI